MRLDFFFSLTSVVCCWTCCRLSPTAAAAAVPAVLCFLALSAIASRTNCADFLFFLLVRLAYREAAGDAPPPVDGGDRDQQHPRSCGLFLWLCVCECVPFSALFRRLDVLGCAHFESLEERAGGGVACAGRVLAWNAWNEQGRRWCIFYIASVGCRAGGGVSAARVTAIADAAFLLFFHPVVICGQHTDAT